MIILLCVLMLAPFRQQAAGKPVAAATGRTVLPPGEQLIAAAEQHAPHDDITHGQSQVFKLRQLRVLSGTVQDRHVTDNFFDQPAGHGKVFPFPLYLLLLRLLLFPNHYFW